MLEVFRCLLGSLCTCPWAHSGFKHLVPFQLLPERDPNLFHHPHSVTIQTDTLGSECLYVCAPQTGMVLAEVRREPWESLELEL